MLLIGLSVLAYKKSHTSINVRINSFNVEKERNLDRVISEKVRVNINEAGQEELMRLPGIGRVIAERILEYRASNGRFYSLDELKKVRGIGNSIFEKIKDNIAIE